MYTLLIAPSDDFLMPGLSKWERDLNRTFISAQRQNIIFFSWNHLFVHVFGKLYIINYYRNGIVLRSLLVGFFQRPQTVRDRFTLFHIFWLCLRYRRSHKNLRFFFFLCFSLYFLILKDPAFLLHCSQMPPQTYRKSVLCHLVNAAKACITLCLKDPNPPSIAMWLNKVRSINAMEDLVLTAQDRREQCTKTWSHWDKFVYSDEGKLLLESCLVDWGFHLSPFNTNTQSIALGGEGGLYFVLGLDFFFALKRKEEGTEVSVWVNLGALFFHLLGMERRKGLSDI